MTIHKKSLDKGLQSRGVRALSLIEYARRKTLCDPIAHALASTLNYEKSHFDKLVPSLLTLMGRSSPRGAPQRCCRRHSMIRPTGGRCSTGPR